MNKLLNASTLLSFTTLIAIAGVSTKNPYLAITGLNLGMSTGIATFVDKKLKVQQQESRIITEIGNLDRQIKAIQHQTQEQHLLLGKYQVNLDSIKINQNKALESQHFVREIDNINSQIKTIKEQSQDRYLLLGQHQETLDLIEAKQNKLVEAEQFIPEIKQINLKIETLKEQIKQQGQLLTTERVNVQQIEQQDEDTLASEQLSQAFNSLNKQIKAIEQQSQAQQHLLTQYLENLENIYQPEHNILELKPIIAAIKSLNGQIEGLEEQSQAQHQVLNQYQLNLKNIESHQQTIATTQKEIQASQVKYQTALNKKQNTLESRFNKREFQIDKHNKKIKENKYEINTHKAKQNKIISLIQAIDKRQPDNIVFKDRQLNEIEKQVDRIIEITTQIQQEQSVDLEPKTIVYIDNNNLYKCLEKINIKIDYQSLFIKLTQELGATQVKLYDGFFTNQTSKRVERERLGYQVFGLPIIEQKPGVFKTVGDDVKLAIDMVNDVRAGDNVILMTGDGDFHPAIKKIKQLQDVNVTVIAQDNSISQYLRQVADEFISLDLIKYDIAKHKLYIY